MTGRYAAKARARMDADPEMQRFRQLIAETDQLLALASRPGPLTRLLRRLRKLTRGDVR